MQFPLSPDARCPCSHPTCTVLTFSLQHGAARTRSLCPALVQGPRPSVHGNEPVPVLLSSCFHFTRSKPFCFPVSIPQGRVHSALTEANTEVSVSRGLQQTQMCTAAAPCAGASPVRLHTYRGWICVFFPPAMDQSLREAGGNLVNQVTSL